MSFSSDLKQSLGAIGAESDCCLRAQTYGMLFYARTFSATGMEIASSVAEVTDRAQANCVRLFGFGGSLRETSGGSRVWKIGRRSEAGKVLAFFGHSANEVAFSLNYANLENDCCLQSFLRGVFLVCGRMTNPERSYLLEFSVGRVKAASSLETLLTNLGYPPLSTVRGNSVVLYYKDSETIEEILTAMGASQAALTVMNTKVYRDLRNRVNRLTNCEASNIGKTVQASGEQIRAIEALRKRGNGLRSLPEELRQVAKLRVMNPDASLSEIGRLCEPPLSRSGVNHRLQRLLALAEETKKA